MKYVYESVTDEAIEIEITEEWVEKLSELDRLEYNSNQTETRRHENYAYGDESAWLADETLDPALIWEELERITETNEAARRALSTLSEKQKWLVYQRFVLKKSVNQIAEEEGVSQAAISRRLARIRKKLEIFQKSFK